MNWRTQAHLAALTGGIASGKSTVAMMFQEFGVSLIDADVVARQVVEMGQPAWHDIVEHFGEDILLENKQIHRKKLGSIIFHHPKERKILNRITHPRVINKIDHEIQQIRLAHPKQVILVDVPLLIETAMHTKFSTIIVVYIPEDVQLRRLRGRDGFSSEDARARIESQMPLVEKLPYATHVIHNNQSLGHTRRQATAVYQQLVTK